MKANFKKASVFALAMALVLLMSLSVIPMVSAEEAAATTDTYYEIEQNYTGDLAVETIGAMNISLSGDIKLMIGYEKDSLTADHSYINIKIESADGKHDKNKTVQLADLVADEDGLYWVEIEVPAAQQTDLVEFKWFDANNEAGKSRKYSVRYYAEKIMGMASGEISTDVDPEIVSNMDQTVKGMLNYGAVSQIAHDYNTEKLANKGLYTDETNPLDNMLVSHLYDAKANTEIDTSKSKFQGVQVYLEGSLRIRIYTNAPAGTDVTIDGESFTTSAEGDYSYVGIYNIPANMYDHQFEIVVNDETLHYSVLGYCLDTLNDYKSNDEQKNIAKALYQYYTWTANYAREDYVPGPKDETTGASVCAHERYYLSGVNVVCSDCGENISETTRVSLIPTVPSFEISESGAEVTFILSVVGSVDLQALCVTPVAEEGLTLEATSIEILEPHTQNVNGTAALNILLDAETAITENTQLAKITYNVKAADAGSYKINLTVNEALNDAEEDVSDFIVPVTAVIEAVKVCTCETKTGYQIDATTGTHRWYCDICKQTGAWEDHTKADVWTPVLEEAGGKVTGELYETRNCTVCATAMEQRLVYYKNNIDSVKVNDTVINPYAGNDKQTTGVLTHPDPGYATFVITPENFIDVNNDALTFKDTDSLKTGGWFGVNGGVQRYVIRINDGTWKTLAGTPGTTKADDNGIGSALSKNANFTDDGRYTNSSYQNGLTFSDLEAYANQTITVTLGAVPANNPGTTENPNVLITAVIENLFVECTHLPQNVASAEATDVPTIFNATCVCGESYATTDVNDEGLKMFNADEIVYRGEGQGGSNYSITKMTENGLDFARFELTCEKASTTELLYYFANGNEGNATNLTYGLSDTFMIIYRANTAYPGSLTLYVNQGSWLSQAYSIKDDSQWHIAMYDLSALYDDTYGRLNTIRFDIFDAVAIEQGATIDIAYMGFFSSEDHALENYAKAAEKHEAIGKAANWALTLDNFLVDGVSYKGQNPPVSGTTGQFGCIQVDLSGFTITVDTAITYRGWLVTPFGAEGIYYTITDADGNVSERRFYLKPGVITESNGIVGATTSYRYGTGRLNGSAFQSTTNTFDLSGYAGETVSIDVILVNNIGQEGTIMQITNVAVSACDNHVLVDVEAKASTCTTPGNEAYKTCKTCGRIYDMNEVELDAIPTLPLDENAHSVVDYAWCAPTTNEYGWEAHKLCEYCLKAWDTEGNPLEARPTIAKIVPTTNKYFGYEDMKGWGVSSKVDTKASDDHSYVRFERTESVGDVYAQFVGDNTSVTGQYLVFKYRTSSEAYVQVWANTLANGHDGGKANATVSTIADGKWHIAVVDLSTLLPNYVQAVDGKYTVQWARIDLLDPAKDAGTYIDFGFIALTDDVSKVGSVLLDGDEDYCSHVAADDAVWTLDPNDPLFEKTDCLICGGKAERYISTTSAGLHIFTPDVMVNKSGTSMKPTLMLSENGMPYINVTASKASGEETAHLFQDAANPIPGSKLGKYVGVLYRTDHNQQIQVVLEGKLNSVQSSVKNLSNVDTNGAWKFEYVDVSKAFSGTTAGGAEYGYDGSQLTAFRIDYFNNDREIGDTVDVAFVAFFNTPAEAYAYYAQYVKAYDINCEHFTTTTAYNSETQLITTTCDACGTVTETKACDHSDVTTVWDSAQKLYTITCDYCGNVETSDMLYKTEGITNAAHVGSGSNFLTATTVTEGDETFTRYTAVGTASDPYFYPIRYNTTNVTGKYMIIKYRVVNNGTNLSTGATFASSAASGQTGAVGNNGDQSMYVAPNTWYADGEWHTIMIQPTDNNKTFTANADGTYTWAYTRIRVDNLAVGGYIDIAEIAFADNAEAADLYACKNDANPVFVVNIDAGNAKIDGVQFLSSAAQKADTVVFDMSQYAALTTPTSIKLGGWVCTRGGVSNYQIRVTKIDGVEVENPELKSFFKPSGYRNDIYTGYGKSHGYTSECANGAGMNLTTVNLTAWAGHTVEFEIVVTTNAGQQFVAVRCQNVVVPEVAE